MLNLLIINFILFFLNLINHLKSKKFIVLAFLILFFINIWIPLFFNYNSNTELYLGNDSYYDHILIWLSLIYFLILINPLRFITIKFKSISNKILIIKSFSNTKLLFTYLFFFLLFFFIGTSNVYLIVLISSIAAVLSIRRNKYSFLFLLTFILLAGAFQRSLIFPLLFLFFLKLYRGHIKFKHIIIFVVIFISIFYIALVGRGLKDASSLKEVISGLNITQDNLSILTSNVSNVNIGSVAFEMRTIFKPNTFDIFDYFFNILAPIPSSFSSFDFQKYYVSRYLGTEPSLGLPMPACYQIYFFFGNFSVIIMYFIFVYLNKLEKYFKFQFNYLSFNIFSFMTIFFIVLCLVYFHHSDLRFFVVSITLSLLAFTLCNKIKFVNGK